jgi:hypothetical protein
MWVLAQVDVSAVIALFADNLKEPIIKSRVGLAIAKGHSLPLVR